MSSFEKDINTINFAPIIVSLESRGKDPSLIFQRTGLDKTYLFSRRNFIDLPTGIIIFNTVKEILREKDPMIFYDLGLEVIKNQELGGVLTIGRALGGIENTIRFLPRFNKKFNDIFEMAVYDIINNSGVLIIDYKKRQYDGTWIFDQCPWNQGTIAGIPYEWGLPFIEIDEAINRFSLQEIFREYSFMGHRLEIDNRNGVALINGKEFAVPVFLKTEPLKKALDKIERLNPLEHKEQTVEVHSNQGYSFFTSYNPKALKAVTTYGMAIVKDTRISDRLTLKEGQIYAHPDCRIVSRLNLKWTGKKNISRMIKDSTIGKWIYAKEIIAGYEQEMQLNLEQRRKLQEYADRLEDMVSERTQELRDTQAKLVETEKRVLEHRITGGFAHEMRNALTGAQLEMKAVLDYQEKGQAATEVIKEAATNLLQRIKTLQVEYQIPKDQIAQTLIPSIKEIAQVIEFLAGTHQDVYHDLERGLSITSQIRDYAKMAELRPGNDPVDLAALLKSYETRYGKDFADRKIRYSFSGPDTLILQGDETHFNSIFTNFIINARDALLEIEKDDKQIHVSIETTEKDGNPQIRIKVWDNGPGIPENHLSEIFEPFFSTKPSSGTGLGLGIVKRLVQLYGGNIEVESQERPGACFTVTL